MLCRIALLSLLLILPSCANVGMGLMSALGPGIHDSFVRGGFAGSGSGACAVNPDNMYCKD